MTTAVAKDQRVRVDVRFDIEHPQARLWAANHAARLVREVSVETKRAIRLIIVDAFRTGTTTQEAAMRIRPLVGLTSRQAQAVVNYWRRLEDDDETPLERARDLAERYAKRLHRERALTIARTESMRAANEGQHQAWQQALERGALTRDDRREWIVTPDDALCELCEPLDRHPPVGFDEPFDTPIGPLMNPPLHPRCRCVKGLVLAGISKARFATVTPDEPEWQQLHRVADRAIPGLVRAMTAAVAKAAAGVSAGVLEATADGAEGAATSAWSSQEPDLLVAFAAALRVPLRAAGKVSAAWLSRQIGAEAA